MEKISTVCAWRAERENNKINGDGLTTKKKTPAPM